MGSSHHTRGAPSGAVWCSKGFTNQHWEHYVIREYFGHLERVFTYDFLFYYMYSVGLATKDHEVWVQKSIRNPFTNGAAP